MSSNWGSCGSAGARLTEGQCPRWQAATARELLALGTLLFAPVLLGFAPSLSGDVRVGRRDQSWMRRQVAGCWSQAEDQAQRGVNLAQFIEAEVPSRLT